MTKEELLAACDQAENGLLKTGKFSVIVPGWREGQRCRVAPGLTGVPLSHLGDEKDKKTLVLLDAKRVRAWVNKNL